MEVESQVLTRANNFFFFSISISFNKIQNPFFIKIFSMMKKQFSFVFLVFGFVIKKKNQQQQSCFSCFPRAVAKQGLLSVGGAQAGGSGR